MTRDDGSPKPAQEPEDDEALREGEAAVWEAVGIGRLGLAYQIARLVRAVEERPMQPSPELLAALALGTAVRGPDDDLSIEFGRRIGPRACQPRFQYRGSSHKGCTESLAIFCVITPCVVRVAARKLHPPFATRRTLSGDLTPIYRLANAIAGHAEKLQGVRLDVTTLSAILDDGVWKERIARHIEDVAAWRSSAGTATFLFAPAGRVWKQWLSGSGILSELARLISTDEPAHAPHVKEIVNLLTNRKSISRFG